MAWAVWDHLQAVSATLGRYRNLSRASSRMHWRHFGPTVLGAAAGHGRLRLENFEGNYAASLASSRPSCTHAAQGLAKSSEW